MKQEKEYYSIFSKYKKDEKQMLVYALSRLYIY
jgi:hypothetical protein